MHPASRVMETPMAFRIATMLPSHLGSRAHIVGPGAVSGPPGTQLQQRRACAFARQACDKKAGSPAAYSLRR